MVQNVFFSFFVIGFITFTSVHSDVNLDPVEIVYVNNYDSFYNFMTNYNPAGKRLNAYCYGSRNETHDSWCGDCINAEPYIDEALEKFGQNTIMLFVDVGSKAEWKDIENNYLRMNCYLDFIPTLIHYEGLYQMKRIEDIHVQNPELLKWFFNE